MVVNGRELRLYVFAHPAPRSPGGSGYCTDGNQETQVPAFAKANPGGLVFNINPSTIPSYLTVTDAIAGIKASFNAWDSAGGATTYFAVNDTGGASGPAFDGNNTVGRAYIVPTYVLAATWVWANENGAVQEADVFFNAFQKWGILTGCNTPTSKVYDVQNVGTHEAGHTVGLNHLSDPNGYATMYPTASKGEVRKRTLTAGDVVGYTAAGGY